MTKVFKEVLFLLVLISFYSNAYAQKIIQEYQPLQVDSLQTGPGDSDFLPYIQAGYTLMLPEEQPIIGVLIFLEDSGYDNKNNSAKQVYNQAANAGFAVLSVSTEIPFDFYFTKGSINTAHQLIKMAFANHNLPNNQVFFLGASLVGHRAMRYIKYIKETNLPFKPNIKGLVMCNFTLDFTRKWYQHRRDIKINRISLWEPRFINYLLETNLEGTPKTVPENYHEFSAYSYFSEQNNNITLYTDYAVRAYIEPAIQYRLDTYYRTLYENNATDLVGFLAELRLAGNQNTDLIVVQPQDGSQDNKSAQSTWDRLDKDELMAWIVKQIQD